MKQYKYSYIGLGSNLNNPVLQLENALTSLSAVEAVEIDRVSKFYESSPIGMLDQPKFANCVVRIKTTLSAEFLLTKLLEVEIDLGRPKNRLKWEARIIDLDILLYGDEVIKSEKLVVPHPELINREFVLVPLLDISPYLTIPGHGSVKNLLSKCDNLDLKVLV